jgi:CMP-N-acetylneuraminic acid synthetase
MDKNKIIVLITARGGSKRVPKKNIRNFMGLPLIVWSINAAKQSKLVDRIIVSSDDEDIINISLGSKVEVHKRSKVLSADHSSTESLLDNLYFETKILKDVKYLVLLQPTSPLRLRNAIDDAIEKLNNDSKFDGLIEVTGRSFSSGKVINNIWQPDYPENTRSQDIPLTYFPTGGLYIYRCPNWFEKKSIKKMIVSQLNINRVVNIDHEDDFDWANYVFKKYQSDYDYLTT